MNNPVEHGNRQATARCRAIYADSMHKEKLLLHQLLALEGVSTKSIALVDEAAAIFFEAGWVARSEDVVRGMWP